jgi:hypothetical protein
MKCKLALVAKEVIISHNTGVPSAINIMEGIQASGFPLLLQEISLLTVWAKDQGDADEFAGLMKVTVGNIELVKEQMTIAFNGKDVARNVATFQGLVLPGPGNLDFLCEFPGTSVTCTVIVSAVGKVESKTA